MRLPTHGPLGPTLLAVAVTLQLGGCAVAVAPYAPVRDPLSITPQGESVPVPSADSNPLDIPRQLTVNCSPQGVPFVSTSDVEVCEEAPDCRVVCSASTQEWDAPE